MTDSRLCHRNVALLAVTTYLSLSLAFVSRAVSLPGRADIQPTLAQQSMSLASKVKRVQIVTAWNICLMPMSCVVDVICCGVLMTATCWPLTLTLVDSWRMFIMENTRLWMTALNQLLQQDIGRILSSHDGRCIALRCHQLVATLTLLGSPVSLSCFALVLCA